MKKKMTALFAAFFMLVSAVAVSPEAQARTYRVPILMYHNVVSGDTPTDSMTITQARFRADMQYLKKAGYTPLNSQDLLNIRNGKIRRPAKPVMITFDDGYTGVYTYVYPVLKETKMKATVSVIASYCGRLPNFLSWEQLREMYKSGLVEIGCHTYALHTQSKTTKTSATGIRRWKGETYAHYRTRVGGDLYYALYTLRKNIPGLRVIYFSYPYGAYDRWFPSLTALHAIYVTTTSTTGTAVPSRGLGCLPRLRVTMQQPVSTVLAYAK